MKRAKIQDIADLLKISRVTVWKVLNNKEGVSEEMRQKVLQGIAQMEYQPNGYQNISLPTLPQKQMLVSVVISRPESSTFWVRIIHQLAEEFSSRGIGLMYTYLPSEISEGYVLPQSLTDGNLHGIIVMNVYELNMLKLLNDLPIPKVFLDIVSNMSIDILKGDLILLEGRNSISKIVSSMIRSGCRKIGFIGDIHYARTNMERYEGYVAALAQHGIEVKAEYCYTGGMTLDTYAEIIENFITGLPFMLDAFVCVNDHAASMLLQYLKNNGYQVPKDVVVSGYDDNNEFAYTKELTTVHVDNQLLGKRLAKQLIYRIDNPEYPYEVTYIRPTVVFRESTEK